MSFGFNSLSIFEVARIKCRSLFHDVPLTPAHLGSSKGGRLAWASNGMELESNKVVLFSSYWTLSFFFWTDFFTSAK